MTTEFLEVNGLRVANIKKYGDIAFFGIDTLAGANFETPETAGIAHFAEHMFFKGTSTKTWKDINREVGRLGMYNNAYTERTNVSYISTCAKENIEPTIGLMMDMFFNSIFPEDELEKERDVIIEEKQMYDDDPKGFFNDEMIEHFFVWDQGHRILGTTESLKSIKRKDIFDFLQSRIDPNNMVFVCAGDVDSKDLRKYIEKYIPEGHSYLQPKCQNIVNKKMWTNIVESPNKIKMVVERENIAQSSVSMLSNGVGMFDKKFLPLELLIAYIGGDSYSPLWTKIREELGLCYSVGMYATTSSYPENMYKELYGFTSPDNIDSFIEESEKILNNIVKNGLEDDLFDITKTSTIARILRRIETAEGLASYLSTRYLFNRTEDIECVINEMRRITKSDCEALIDEFIACDRYWAIMVPKK